MYKSQWGNSACGNLPENVEEKSLSDLYDLNWIPSLQDNQTAKIFQLKKLKI